MFIGIHHTCLTVEDIERSVAFYRDLLGLEVLWDSRAAGLELKGPVADRATRCPGTEQRVVYLELQGDLLELMEFSPPGKKLTDNKLCDIGSPHVCFLTDDIDELYCTLRANGVDLHCAPQDLGETRIFFFRDPDGIILEAMGGTPTVEAERPRIR